MWVVFSNNLCILRQLMLLHYSNISSDVRYGKFCILPITIIALFFYHDTINYPYIQIT